MPGFCSERLAAFLTIPPIQARTITWPIAVGLVAAVLGIWTASRGRPQARLRRGRGGHDRPRARHPRDPLEHREPERRLRRSADRTDARVRDAAHVRRDRRDVLGTQRRREHRPRGNDADGRLLRRLRRRQGRLLDRRAARRRGCGRSARARLRLLRHSSPGRPDRRRHGCQLPGARDHGVLLLPALQRQLHPERRLEHPERQHPVDRAPALPRPGDRASQPDDLGVVRAGDRLVLRALPDADRAAHPRVRRASARGGHRRDQRLRRALRLRDALRAYSRRSAACTSPTASAAGRSSTT